MSWTFMQSFSFIPLMASEKKIFEYFFRKFSLLVALWQPIKISDFDKIQMVGRGLLQEHFCKTFVKISAVTKKYLPISSFPVVSLWKL